MMSIRATSLKEAKSSPHLLLAWQQLMVRSILSRNNQVCSPLRKDNTHHSNSFCYTMICILQRTLRRIDRPGKKALWRLPILRNRRSIEGGRARDVRHPARANGDIFLVCSGQASIFLSCKRSLYLSVSFFFFQFKLWLSITY